MALEAGFANVPIVHSSGLSTSTQTVAAYTYNVQSGRWCRRIGPGLPNRFPCRAYACSINFVRILSLAS